MNALLSDIVTSQPACSGKPGRQCSGLPDRTYCPAVRLRPMIRMIVILLILSGALSTSARANTQSFSVDNNDQTCAVCDQVDGCFNVDATTISYDLSIPGKLNSDFTGANVVLADPPGSCTTGGVVLFALTQVGGPTDPARFSGVFVLPPPSTPGVCPGDIVQCLNNGDGLMERVINEANACKSKIIKDTCIVIPTVSDWGFLVMIVLVLIAGTIVFRRRAVAL